MSLALGLAKVILPLVSHVTYSWSNKFILPHMCLCNLLLLLIYIYIYVSIK